MNGGLKNVRWFLVAVTVALSGCPSRAPKAEAETRVAPKTKQSAPMKEKQLDFLTRGSSLEAADAVAIFFHGYGADASDLLPLGERLALGPGVALVFPQAPLTLEPRGRAWFRRDRSDFREGLAAASRFVEKLLERHPSRPLVLGGFSQGAMLVANLVVDPPKQVVAGLIWSPADQLAQPLVRPEASVPLFVSHGRQDPVLPFSGAETLVAKFRVAKFEVAWFPFDGVHSIPPSALDASNRFLMQEVPGFSPARQE